MADANVKPHLDEGQIEAGAQMVASAENSDSALAFVQGTVDDVSGKAVAKRVQEIRSAKSFAIMQPKLKKDAKITDATALHTALERVAKSVVSLTECKLNNVGGGKNLEHSLRAIPTPAGLLTVIVAVGKKTD
jgi:hypothetical protein